MLILTLILYRSNEMSQMPSYDEILQKNIALEKENKELKKFQSIFQSANDGMAITDLKGNFLDVNTKLCSTLGYSRGEFLKMNAIDIKPVDLNENFEKNMELLRDQGFITEETAYIHKNSTQISLEIRASILEIDANPVIQVIARDITQRQLREEVLQQYKNIFSLTDDLVTYVDKNYIYQLVNASFCKSYNKKCDEIVGMSVPELIGEELFHQVVKPAADRCLSGETVHFRRWIDHLPTGRRYRDINYTPYLSSTGKIVGFLAVIHDLTDLQLAREAQEAERQHLNTILQAIPDGVYIVDCEYTINYINPIIEKQFGPVDGRKCFTYLHNRSKPCENCQKEKVFSGESVQRQWNSTTNDKHYDIFDTPLVNAQGIFAKVTFFHDVTNAKKVQEKLETNQSLLHALINNSPEIIFIKDMQNKYILINDQYAMLFKRSKQDIIGATDDELFPEELAQKFQTEDREVCQNNIIIQSESTIHLNGENCTQITTKFPLIDPKGSVYAIGGIATDITKHKQLEQDLQYTNKRLTALINASPDITYFKDGAGKWLLANDSGLLAFQLTDVDYKGKTDAELAPFSEFYHDAFLACMESDEEAWNSGILSKCEEIIPTPDGENKVFDIVKVPLFNTDGTRQGLVVQGHDITNHLKTENNLRKEIVARRKAAEVIQEKSKELEDANIALRVLLKQEKDIAGEVQERVLIQLEKAVLPYLNLLRQSQLDAKGKECLDIISEHISEVGSSFTKQLSNPDLKLTKKEMLVADLVKSGKSTKNIAILLSIKVPSVESYRNQIRKKLGINNKKISLYRYLSTTFPSNS